MRYHKGRDGWGRGSYSVPQYAVAGSSDCGSFRDSPAPTASVVAELEAFRKVLRAKHIRSHIQYTTSGNAFMAKRWVVVHSKNFLQANTLAEIYLREHHNETRYIHDGT